MSRYAQLYSTRRTPQSEPIPGREKEMVKNYAGGYTFQLEPQKQLERFLILGADSPTYYAGARKMTRDNAQVVIECANKDPELTARTIRDVSVEGRAFNNDAAIFALAIMAELSSTEARKFAFRVVNDVCRTASQFFLLQMYLDSLGGSWNRSRRNMVQAWYDGKNAGQLAYQMLKYRNRYGWTHQDIINLAHISTSGDDIKHNVVSYVMTGEYTHNMPEIAEAYIKLQAALSEREVVQLIQQYKPPWEFIPSRWLDSDKVWAALIPNMPYTALLRNLGQLTSRGLLKFGTQESRTVIIKLNQAEFMKRARVHPFSILVAQRVYAQGHGVRGKLKWEADKTIVEVLEDAFYNSFNYVEPSGKNIFIGIDASGSVSCPVNENIPMTVGEAEAVMAMVAARREPWVYTEAYAMGQSLGVDITRNDSLADAAHKIHRVSTGSTDLSAPMRHALKSGYEVDTFLIMTDNETWRGNIHPVQALAEYRKEHGPAKMIVAAFTSTGFSIADPADPDNLDIVGLDTNTPALISQFSKGL